MTWNDVINEQKKEKYFIQLEKTLNSEYDNYKIYPSKEKIYKAFDLCEYENLKVVILGQDPYHQPNQAQGLAFSTPANIKNPPTMMNIIKEVISDTNDCLCINGDLEPWAKQGVLLINTVFTVRDSSAKSHDKIGWQTFSDNIISHINDNFKNVVFILWGTNAIKKSKLINKSKHHILTSVHPSPLSSYRGFFGSRPFSKTNTFLKNINKKPIKW